MTDQRDVSRGTFHGAEGGPLHIQAFYRPRHGDVRVIARSGETLDVPEGDIPDLVAALASAFAIPFHAAELMRERPQATAFNAV